jgi:hypothetical protein
MIPAWAWFAKTDWTPDFWIIPFNDARSNGFEIELYNHTIVSPVRSMKTNARCPKLLFFAVVEGNAGSGLNP